MKLPCELVTKELLPAFRRMLARKLVNDYGLSQIKVAALMGITQASVNYYIRSKRGVRSSLNIKFLEPFVDRIAHQLYSGKLSQHQILKLFCQHCSELRSMRFLCQLHSAQMPSLDTERCEAC